MKRKKTKNKKLKVNSINTQNTTPVVWWKTVKAKILAVILIVATTIFQEEITKHWNAWRDPKPFADTPKLVTLISPATAATSNSQKKGQSQKLVESLSVGLVIDSITDANAMPYSEQKVENRPDETQRSYCTKDMFLIVTYDRTRTILDYFVVSKSPSFNPVVTTFNGPLRKMRFSEHKDEFANSALLTFRDQYLAYIEEAEVPAKQNLFRQLILAYYFIGYTSKSTKFTDWGQSGSDQEQILNPPYDSLIRKIKTTVLPNAFGISSGRRFLQPDQSPMPTWVRWGEDRFNCL
ncbi:ETEC_3214 domain-containing protein [Bdellovibrio sp. HCB-162]|uniref:ETEC_3214 domain-containing protein n=1 Tax=Bdellovibrio sp. HCB-162 TaxID=3394234 RepID=UPI0039BC3EE6